MGLSNRFNLRALLIATLIVAVALGLIEYAGEDKREEMSKPPVTPVNPHQLCNLPAIVFHANKRARHWIQSSMPQVLICL